MNWGDDFSALPQHDRDLIERARRVNWERIDINAAITPEGREILYRIAVAERHYDEAKNDMI